MYHCVIPQLKRDIGRARDSVPERAFYASEKPVRSLASATTCVRNSPGSSKIFGKPRPSVKYGISTTESKTSKPATTQQQNKDSPKNKVSQPISSTRNSKEETDYKAVRIPHRLGSIASTVRKYCSRISRLWPRRPLRSLICPYRSSGTLSGSRQRSVVFYRKECRRLLHHCCQQFSRSLLDDARFWDENAGELFMNNIVLSRTLWGMRTRKAFHVLLSNRECGVLWKPRSEEERQVMWMKWDTLDDLTPFRRQMKDIVPLVTLENLVDGLLEFPLPREWKSKDDVIPPVEFWLSVASSQSITWESLREVFAELSPMHDNHPVSYFEKDYKLLMKKKEQPFIRSLRRRDVLQVKRLCRLGCPSNLREPTWSNLLRSKASEKSEYQQLFRSFLKYESFLDWIAMCAVSESVGNSDQFFNFATQTQQVLLLFQRDDSVRRNYDGFSELSAHGKVDSSSKKSEHPIQLPLPFHEFPMYAAPLAYVCLQTSSAYFLFRELYNRYFHFLHEISSHPQSIISLYALFESLLYAKEPSIWEHLRVTLGFHPGLYVVPWIIMAFSGYIEIDQLLLLWDRIIGYNDLRILTILSLGIFISRGRVLLKCSTCRDVGVVLSDIFNIQIVPLLQVALFS